MYGVSLNIRKRPTDLLIYTTTRKAVKQMAKTPKRKGGHAAPKQLCWFCQNAYAHKCVWIKHCQPIEGWTVTPTLVEYTKSYEITACPNFIAEERSVY